ncbi:uncharacterized protein LOC111830196 [Capsella rubella]|uniref:uncharacterized protein LOC111830196 n=1 Tax=Capsella rubella TaxID=81985 RepID=UPI000CD57139|nr:uncharacterized protein LOC111830196 [Capsella rubella]
MVSWLVVLGSILLVILLFLIYVIRQLYYEATIPEGPEADKKARPEEEHLISPSVSEESSSGETKETGDVRIAQVCGLSGDEMKASVRPPRTAYYAGSDFVLQGQTDSDSD